MNDPIDSITELLREEHGIPLAKIYPSARLVHDLGVDGDDMSDLLLSLNERFGSDFTALTEHLTTCFSKKGSSSRSIVTALALLVPSTACTV